MKRDDWVLLTIARAGDRPLQPVQLQKSLFLVGRNLSKSLLKADPFYRFRAYDYGPFAAEVYTDAEAFESLGFVTITRPPSSRYKLYLATPAGRQQAESLEAGLSAKAKEYLSEVVQFVQSLTFDQLVAAIYHAYPDMKVNSVFQN